MAWYFFTGVWWFDALGTACVAAVCSLLLFLAGGQDVLLGTAFGVVAIVLLSAGVWGGRDAGWTFHGAKSWMTGKPLPDVLLVPAHRLFPLSARIGLTSAGLSLFVLFFDVLFAQCTASGPCQPNPPVPVALPLFFFVLGVLLFLIGAWRPRSGRA